MVQIFYIEWVSVTGEDSNTVVMLFDPLLVSTGAYVGVQKYVGVHALFCSFLLFCVLFCLLFFVFPPRILSMGHLNLSTSIFSHSFFKQLLC